MNKFNSYMKNLTEDGKYFEVIVTEEVKSEKPIVEASSEEFLVIATGAYGRIKVANNEHVWCMDNPYTNSGNDDGRKSRTYYATSNDADKVLDMKNAIFSLSPLKMSNLHNELYIPKKDNSYWVDL